MRAVPWAFQIIADRGAVEALPHDRIVQADGSPYLDRFHVVSTPSVQVRFHRWRSGDPRHMHDHPWPSFTLLLEGSLVEHTPHGSKLLEPGDSVVRPARLPHRIELLSEDALTLFVTGKWEREWGFIEDGDWRPWREVEYAGRTLA